MSGQEHDGNNGTNPEREGFAQNRGETEREDTLTNRQGHPISDNQNVRTVGNRGPMTLENYHYLEKITHFDRERIPERVVHARGAGAHGYFEAYGKVGDEPFRSIPEPSCFRLKASAHQCLSGSQPSSTVPAHLKRFGIRAGLP